MMDTVKIKVRRKTKSGRGRMGGTAAGPGGDCVCPECGAHMDRKENRR
jgi:hypothetical protein